MTKASLERRIGKLETIIRPNPEYHILAIVIEGFPEDNVYLLIEKDGSSKGRFVRNLTREEYEKFNSESQVVSTPVST